VGGGGLFDQDMPLDDSHCGSHFCEHTVRKLPPAACDDDATGPDQWSVQRDDNLLEDVANLLQF